MKSIILKQNRNLNATKSSSYSSSKNHPKNHPSSKIIKTMLHKLLSTLDDDKASNNSSLAADETLGDEENKSTLLVSSAICYSLLHLKRNHLTKLLARKRSQSMNLNTRKIVV